MLTIEQYDLSCLAEELAEIQQMIGKAIKHGLQDCNPENGESNFDAIQRETFDAVYYMKRLNIKSQWSSQVEFNARDSKYEKWLKYSQENGAVEPTNDI